MNPGGFGGTLGGVHKLLAALIIASSLVGCTEYGAWDLFRVFAGEEDILEDLAARYTFDNSAATASDDSGSGLDGVLFGATWVSDGVRGGVLELNGSNDYVQLPPLIGSASEFTISAWVNLSSTGTIDSIYGVDSISPRGVRFFTAADGTLRCIVEGNDPTPRSARSSLDLAPGTR